MMSSIRSSEKVAEAFDEKDDYLSYISNDIPKFIGYKNTLKNQNDLEGLRLWNSLNKSTLENRIANKERIEKLLKKVPLYFLLALLGYSQCKIE